MSELCDACRVFGISREAFRSSPFKERRMHQLGSFHDVASRSYCPLCTLVAQAYQKGPVPVEVLESSRVQGSWWKISDGEADACLEFWLMGRDDLQVQLTARILTDGEEPSIGAGRLIDPKSAEVPLHLVKDWIHRCEHTHPCRSVPLSATRAGRLPFFFTVVDVEAKCLVQPDSDCRFLALSYVWGSSVRFTQTLEVMKQLSSDGSLETVWDQLPPSVRDAIVLTQKLGERYIWIDALCISQQGQAGAPMAKQNIQAMDSIYRHALCVIIAADDRAPDFGLAGVSISDRKVQQHVAEIVPGLRLLARFAPEACMAQSTYRTRGWTYQEEQLSTRLLIFTNNQVYFSCPSFAYSEDIEAECNSKPDSLLLFQQQSSKIVRETPNHSGVYFQSVQAFTLRNLRFPADILRAFAGVEALQSQMLSSDVLGGLPTSIFDAALLWQPVARLTRRPGFPSWSWAGWQGGARWLGDTLESIHQRDSAKSLDALNTWLRERTCIVWYCLDEHQHVEPVWNPGQKDSIGEIFWPTAGTLKGAAVGYCRDVDLQNIYGRSMGVFRDPINSVRNQSNQQTLFQSVAQKLENSKEHITPLFFKTLVVSFRIQASTAYLRYGSTDPVWQPDGRVVFLLLNRNNAVSGYVLLDESWKPQDMSIQEFLLLSEANYYCDWGRPHEGHPYRKFYGFTAYEEYHVMMVTWRTLDTGLKVAERAGIGRVLREAAGDAYGDGPEAKEVVLV